jgi:DNA polymerase kappa
MPGFIARKLCPHLVFVKTDFAKYTAASEETRAVFRCYDPAFEAGSLDEAYLDVTDYCQEQGVTGEQVRGMTQHVLLLQPGCLAACVLL